MSKQFVRMVSPVGSVGAADRKRSAVATGNPHPKTSLERNRTMRTRIKKQFWFTEEENRELKRKAKLCGITETAVIRILVKGFEPKEKPDSRFYNTMRELSAIGNNINQLAAKANTLGFIDTQKLQEEALRWHRFQADIESCFLRPTKSDLKWQ